MNHLVLVMINLILITNKSHRHNEFPILSEKEINL